MERGTEDTYPSSNINRSIFFFNVQSATLSVYCYVSLTDIFSQGINFLFRPTSSMTQRDNRYDSFGLGLKDSLRIYEKQNKGYRAEEEAQQNKAENNMDNTENIAKTTQGQEQHEGPATPQTNVEQQRRVSLGILKAPSRCSSTDLPGANGKEKRKLKVTFQDEVVQQARKLPSKSPKVGVCMKVAKTIAQFRCLNAYSRLLMFRPLFPCGL